MIDAIPDYADLPLGRFLDMVASREPAPGGGASAAVVVALAAALTSMAARFSKDHLTGSETIADKAEELRNRVSCPSRGPTRLLTGACSTPTVPPATTKRGEAARSGKRCRRPQTFLCP